jgi:hypothetical protein
MKYSILLVALIATQASAATRTIELEAWTMQSASEPPPSNGDAIPVADVPFHDAAALQGLLPGSQLETVNYMMVIVPSDSPRSVTFRQTDSLFVFETVDGATPLLTVTGRAGGVDFQQAGFFLGAGVTEALAVVPASAQGARPFVLHVRVVPGEP